MKIYAFFLSPPSTAHLSFSWSLSIQQHGYPLTYRPQPIKRKCKPLCYIDYKKLFSPLLLIFLLSYLQRNSCFYRFQLQAHTFRWKKLWGNARRTQGTPRADTWLRWSIQAVSHEKVLQWNQHGMRLLLCYHWPTCLNLQDCSTHPPVNKARSHANQIWTINDGIDPILTSTNALYRLSRLEVMWSASEWNGELSPTKIRERHCSFLNPSVMSGLLLDTKDRVTPNL